MRFKLFQNSMIFALFTIVSGARAENPTVCSKALKPVSALVFKESIGTNGEFSKGRPFLVICENGVLRDGALTEVGDNATLGFFEIIRIVKTIDKESAELNVAVFKGKNTAVFDSDDFDSAKDASVKTKLAKKFVDLILQHGTLNSSGVEVYGNSIFTEEPQLTVSDQDRLKDQF